jgi:putative endonuclease
LMEKKLKGWSRKKKEALISGNFSLLHELSECKNESNSMNFLRRKIIIIL